MKILTVIAILITLGEAQLLKNYPDAIRCGGDNTCCDGAIYMAHSLWGGTNIGYAQVYAG